MKTLTKKPSILISTLMMGLLFAGIAYAAQTNFTLFGEAELVSPGNSSPTAAKLTSDTDPGFAGVRFEIPEGIPFADLTELSTDYKFLAGNCANGSPRFQVRVSSPDGTNVGNIFVYVGDYPNYTNCPTGSWENSGDLLESGKYVDASQIQAGAQYKPYADAVADFGAYEVLSIVLVIDSGYVFPTTGQIVEVDNVRINAGRYSFETANSCKNGGWENFTSAPGPFSNQGQCVSYFAKGGQ